MSTHANDEMRMRVLIVGAGQAAAQLVASLREKALDCEIVVFGDEAHPPYQRPPLSKAFFAPGFDSDRLLFREAGYYREAGVDLRLSSTVTAIDRVHREVIDDGGLRHRYDALVIATGARARRLSIPGSALPGVFTLRSLADARVIEAKMRASRSIVIVGAGYVGLELAASARASGLSVTVLEAAERVLARVASPYVSAAVSAIHARAGVVIETGIEVSRFEGEQHITGVICANGQQISADMVVVGVGAIPNDALAKSAGLEVDGGIVVDAFGRTADASIYAAGDCTCTFDERLKRRVRFESVPRAVDQAKAVAALIANEQPVPLPAPWFWSDQHGCKLQAAGLMTGFDSSLVRPSPDGCMDSFSEFYFQGDELIAAASLNRPQEFMLTRRVLGHAPLVVNKAALANASIAMTEALKAA